MDETDVAMPVMDWMIGQKWDCYPEAQFRSYGARADIVGVQNGLVWIVEVKTRLSHALLEQAANWRGRAHYVSIAFPSRRKALPSVVDVYCDLMGLGVISVRMEDWRDQIQPIEIKAPRLNRCAHRNAKAIITKLHEDMKQYAPGNNSGDYSSPFNRTMIAARLYVKNHPGCTAKELAENVDHHYLNSATARSCFVTWLRGSERYGIRAEQDGKRLRFYPVANKEAPA